MSDKPKKRLTLKERIALKKKKKIESYKPPPLPQETYEQKEARLAEEELKSKLAEEKVIFDEELNRTYEMYSERYQNLREELKTFNMETLEEEDEETRYEYMLIYGMLEAMQKVRGERWEKFKETFAQEDLALIADSYKLYNKYMIMKDVQQKVHQTLCDSYEQWRNDYKDFLNTIDKLLGFKIDKEIHGIVDLHKQRIRKIKEKQNIIDKPQFKKIEWSPEQLFKIEDLLQENVNHDLISFDLKREPLIMIFIGHVDSGKSTISGQILYQTGKVNELEVEQLKQNAKDLGRDSWWAAYIMDINKEEREKGKTVECGRATFETKNKRFTILDCPGHKNYVQNMIEGAAQADLAVLVVSARAGEFEAGFEKTGQTREHAMLSKALGA